MREKIAAVLILIIEKDGKEVVLLTKRNSKMRTHPGQISFPGGRMDPEDKTIIDTALREAREEVGLIECSVLQVLQPCVSAHGLLVYPVLAKCKLFEPILSVDEVECIYYFEFKLFIQPVQYDHSDWDMKTSKFYEKFKGLGTQSTVVRLHQFEINEKDSVWGLTSELAIQAATIYFHASTNYNRMSPNQTKYWWEITEWFFKNK